MTASPGNDGPATSSMYLDTDILLAMLKAEDWLQADVKQADFDAPKTSLITAVEIQLVMFDTWSRSQLAEVRAEIEAEDVDLLPLTADAFQAGADLLPAYESLNVFDAIHVGHARTLDEPLVSTDTLYPRIDEIEHIDPREL